MLAVDEASDLHQVGSTTATVAFPFPFTATITGSITITITDFGGPVEGSCYAAGGEVFGALARTKARPGRGAGSAAGGATGGVGASLIATRTTAIGALLCREKTKPQCSCLPAGATGSEASTRLWWETSDATGFSTIATWVISPCSAQRTCCTLASCHDVQDCVNPVATTATTASSRVAHPRPRGPAL